RLRDLRDQCLRVAQHQTLKWTTPLELILEHFCFHSECATCDLYDRTIRRCLASKEESDANHSIISRQTDLSGRAVLHRVKQRDHAGRRKVNVLHVAARFVDNLAKRESNML